ncbi:ligand-dependent nuclear receptor-interacting factor 1 isoform X2 [Perognathus longimembris pacificus]|nr:ligand-dependent nuclear receptor-interacting factor 1 isoform X2 [Perognathus longimembris pacificus]
MASTIEKGTERRNDKKDCQRSSNKAPYLKNDAEFKKMFGITKDLRIFLTRIPDHLGSGKGFHSFSSVVEHNIHEETEAVVKEEERQQNFGNKRKAKTIKMDHRKKRKGQSAFNAVINGGTDVTSSQTLSNFLPASDALQHNFTSHRKTSEEKSGEAEHCSSEKHKKEMSPNAAFEQSHSCNKNYTEDVFPVTPPELEETIRDEKIRRLKQILKEKEAALEEMRKKMHQK